MFWNKKKDTYNQSDVQYIIRKILQTTVDREVLKEIIENDLRPIIGNKVVQDFYLKLNFEDIEADDEAVNFWVEILNKEFK